MFDFEKLDVYQHLKSVTVDVLKFIAKEQSLDTYYKDQLKRASLSALLNLSEGTGRRTPADKKRFYTMSRSSIFEVVAIMEVMKDMALMDQTTYDKFYEGYTKASKMLLGMYRALNT